MGLAGHFCFQVPTRQPNLPKPFNTTYLPAPSHRQLNKPAHHIMAIIAVAGGTGNVGRAIVEAILAAGKHEVKILSRKVLIIAYPSWHSFAPASCSLTTFR